MSWPRKSAAHLTKLHIKQMALKMYLSQYEKYIKIIVKIQIFRYIGELSQNSGMNREDLSTPNGIGVKRMLECLLHCNRLDKKEETDEGSFV